MRSSYLHVIYRRIRKYQLNKIQLWYNMLFGLPVFWLEKKNYLKRIIFTKKGSKSLFQISNCTSLNLKNQGKRYRRCFTGQYIIQNYSQMLGVIKRLLCLFLPIFYRKQEMKAHLLVFERSFSSKFLGKKASLQINFSKVFFEIYPIYLSLIQLMED